MGSPIIETCGQVSPPIQGAAVGMQNPAHYYFPSSQVPAQLAPMHYSAAASAVLSRSAGVEVRVRRLPVVGSAQPAATASADHGTGLFGAPPAMEPSQPTYNARRPAPGASFSR
jgi:hypothetical protein